MKCEFCRKTDSVEVELRQIHELIGDRLYPHTYSYDVEGKLLKICPRCFTVDNQTLRGTRELLKNILENEPGYSRRDKKAVATIICNARDLNGEERKTTMSTIINDVKFVTDRESEQRLAKFFDVTLSKIQTLFYNVKIYRILNNGHGGHSHKKRKERKNWWVIKS